MSNKIKTKRMSRFGPLLKGGDLRSIGKSHAILSKVKNQGDFDELFMLLHSSDKIVGMRAADSVEKITIVNPSYLSKYKANIFKMCSTVKNKELQWHLAQLIPRLYLNSHEFDKAWNILIAWAVDKNNSQIVRVNSIQSLFEMTLQKNEKENDFKLLLRKLEKEDSPSIKARIKRIREQL